MNRGNASTSASIRKRNAFLLLTLVLASSSHVLFLVLMLVLPLMFMLPSYVSTSLNACWYLLCLSVFVFICCCRFFFSVVHNGA